MSSARAPHPAPAAQPGAWNAVAAKGQLLARLLQRARAAGLRHSAKRVRFQVELDKRCRHALRDWPADAQERAQAWAVLEERAWQVLQEIVPTCILCGDCCRLGAPALHAQDVQLVRSEKIPLSALLTLRRGEPVHSAFASEPFHLPQERIKLRQRPDSTTCIMLDPETDRCRIYQQRPSQCEAQACWDPALAQALAERPLATRAQILAGADTLLELLEEHDRRCSFERLQRSFERLRRSGDDEDALEAIAFEAHFRQFVADRLQLPASALGFFFGRSAAELATLFGYRAIPSPQGGLTLVALEA